MPAGNAATPSGTRLPILLCRTCDPPRPMIIKTVKTSVLWGSQKILFACASCDALIELGPADDASDVPSTGKQPDP